MTQCELTFFALSYPKSTRVTDGYQQMRHRGQLELHQDIACLESQ